MAEQLTFDSLKGCERCPKTDSNGIQKGAGGNPPDRRYIAMHDVVDAGVALARMHSRKTGEAPKILGGLDDNDPKLYLHRRSPAPFGKTAVAQGSALTEEEVLALKSGTAAEGPPKDLGPRHAGVVGESGSAGVRSSASEAPGLEDPRDGDLFPSMGGPAGSVMPPAPAPSVQEAAPVPPQEPKVLVRERVVEKPVERVVEKVVEVEKPAPWAEWLKKRVRVEISTPDMTFHVSAVDVIRSGHGITVLLPTANGAMTFVPNIGSSVAIGTKDTGRVETTYTGVSFDLEAVGLFGLCFLVPPK